MRIARFRGVRALRVLLATLIAVPLLAWSASEGAIAYVLRDVERPPAPKLAPSLVHRGLACVEGRSERSIARRYARGQGVSGHVRELALGLWLTRRFDDDQLIRLAGDSIWLGRGAYGLEAGARAWFGRSLEELSPAQSALLVGLANGPTVYDPTRHRDSAARRRQFVLGRWQTCGLVPPGSAIGVDGTSALDGVLPAGGDSDEE